MRTIGSAVADIAFGGALHRDAANVLAGLREKATGDLARLGVGASAISGMVDGAESALLAVTSLCESPIEQIMLAALALMIVPGADSLPAIHDVSSGTAWPVKPIVIVPQFVIARYRLDFLIWKPHFMLAVECDGRDFHSSRMARANDMKRDTYLKVLGIKTIRYTGQWIYRQGPKAADEVAAILQEKFAGK